MSGSAELEGSSRRKLLVGAIYGIWVAMAAALGLPALVYLFVPPNARKEAEWTPVGDITGLAPNLPVEMVFRQNRVDGWKISQRKGTRPGW